MRRSAVNRLFTRIANHVASLAGKPPTFIAAALIILVWVVTGPVFQWSDTWQLVVNTGTTIVTFLMVFLIQNSQNRDAAAMQAKLDEILRAVDQARTGFIGIEHRTDREIEELRSALEHECSETGDADLEHAHRSVNRLLRRM